MVLRVNLMVCLLLGCESIAGSCEHCSDPNASHASSATPGEFLLLSWWGSSPPHQTPHSGQATRLQWNCWWLSWHRGGQTINQLDWHHGVWMLLLLLIHCQCWSMFHRMALSDKGILHTDRRYGNIDFCTPTEGRDPLTLATYLLRRWLD